MCWLKGNQYFKMEHFLIKYMQVLVLIGVRHYANVLTYRKYTSKISHETEIVHLEMSL